MNKQETEWDRVMRAYRKGNAMRLKEVKAARERHAAVYDSKGEKSTCEEIQEIFKAGGFIIDVRNPVDYISGGKIHNSVNVPIHEIINWCNANVDIDYNTKILVYSNTGNMAGSAKQMLEAHLYTNVTNIGTHKWYTLCS